MTPPKSSIDDLPPGGYRVYHSWYGEEKGGPAYSLVQNLGEYPDSAETPVTVVSEKKLSGGCFRIDKDHQMRPIRCSDDSETQSAE